MSSGKSQESAFCFFTGCVCRRYFMKLRASCAIWSAAGIEREMARIEDVDFGLRHIFAVAFRFAEIE